MTTLTDRFPFRVAMGFEGGSGYSTSIAVVLGGAEKRNQNRSNSLGRWTATQQNKRQAITEELIAFYHAAGGRANDFPFRDWSDYRCAAGDGSVVLVSGATYQLYKQYVSGGVTRLRKIIRPVNSVVAGGGSYSVSSTTGLLTHLSGAAPAGWSGEFDVLCRFESDDALSQLQAVDKMGDGTILFTWGNIGITEVRLPS